MPDAVENRVCTICNQAKPPEEFYKKNAATGALMAKCKDCHKKADRERTRRKRAEKDGSGPPKGTATDTTNEHQPEHHQGPDVVQDNAATNGQPSDDHKGVYARGVMAYHQAGWPGVIPAWGPGDKRPVAGYTGDKNHSIYPDDNQIVAWCTGQYADANLLIRLAPNLIGIDKDAYENKTGAKTIQEAENRWGPLPAAWCSSSRIDDPEGSGIYIYKVPEGWRARGEISFSELAISDVEIIQHHHRTVGAWPSVHPITGNVYRWRNPQGELVPEGVVPSVDDHPELPLEWLKGLANTKANRSRERRRKDNQPDDNDLPLADISALLTEGRMTKDVAARFGQALYAITDGSDRHKSTLGHTLALLGMGARGQAGVGYAIRELNKAFVQFVAPEREHGENEADHEFQRMILGAGRLLDEGEGEEGAGDDTDTGETPDPGATPANVQQSWSGPLPTVALLHDILEEAGKDVRELGVVGEESTVKAVFLSLVSRLQDQPVSVGVKGDSSSGKSWVVKKVVRLFPDWAFHARTAMSGKALIYSAEEYVHRTIILYEVTGMRENSDDDMTAYFIRTLLSEGRIDYEVTVKDPHTGGMTTNRITKEGPTNLIFTTTQDSIHAENETRVLSLNTDDSNEQTKRVMEQLADETASTVDLGRWHDLQQWLASDEAEKRVTIPFAKALSRLTPPSAVRLRRDFGAILALIRAHAMLHQATRQRDADEQIIATVEQDYDAVRKLVSPAISQGIGATVSDTLITTVAAVQALNEEYTRIGKSLGATNGAVAKRLNVNTSTASRRLKAAARREYVQNLETKSGVAARWVVGDEPLPETAEILPTVAALQDRCTGVAAGNGSDQDNCSVAADSGVEGVEEECTS